MCDVKVDEKVLFQTAYFYTYNKAEERCMRCFADYLRSGHIPHFVNVYVRHITSQLVTEGDQHEKARGTEGRTRMFCVR